MALIIFIIALVLIIIFFRKFSNLVYFVGIVEILFRLLHIIGDAIGVSQINNFINKFVPESILSMISRDASGLLYKIFLWVFIIIFVIFEFYLIRYFFKKKK